MTAKKTEVLISHHLQGERGYSRRAPRPYTYTRVWLDRKLLDPRPSQKIINHSPDGFNWGYGGSGPAQLAAAIMLELQADIYQPIHYQYFNRCLIAHIPKENFELEFQFPPIAGQNGPEDYRMKLISKHIGVNL